MKVRKNSPVFINVKSTHGFTLLEVMVGMFVSVTMIAAILTSIIQILKHTEATRDRTVAVALLTDKIEETRLVPFSTLVASLNYPTYTSGTYTFNDRNYQWSRTVSTPVEETAFGSIQVLTTVIWISVGRTYSIYSTSYISPYGIVAKSSL